MNILLCIILWK